MSIESVSTYGWFISHEHFIKDVYKNIDNSSVSFQIKPELFKILTPFKQLTTKQGRKATRQAFEDLEKEVQKVKGLFENFYEELADKHDIKSSEETTMNTEALETAVIVYTESGKHLISDLQGGNNCTCPTAKVLQESTFLFPQNCRFYCQDVVNISQYLSQQYDIILIDPPWRNKYIRRKRKKTDHAYNMMHDEDLKQLPLENFLKDDALIAVWCTNSLQHMKALQTSIFPKWGVTFISKWYWVKVTKSLKTVCSFSKPPGKQPFEQIVFGCKKGRSCENPPDNKLVVSVPSAVHSHKPPLTDLLEPYLPRNPNCLEIFARYLLPNWTSYGNEALRMQHECLYNKVSA